MLHRALLGTLNRAIIKYTSPIKAASRKHVIRNSTTRTFRKHVAVVRSSKSDSASGIRELSIQQDPNLKSIKNAYCKELSLDDVGTYVHLRGMVVHVEKGQYAVLKDKTGAVFLFVDYKRKDLKKWLNELEKYSKLKIIGIVRAKQKQKNASDNGDDKEPIDVVVTYVISTLPPSNKCNTKETVEEQPEWESELLKQLTASENTLTCEQITREKIGSNIQVFGWIKTIDGERQNFILQDATGFIRVSPHIANMNILNEVKKLNRGDLVVVEGLVSHPPLQLTNLAHSKNMDKLQISAKFIKKLNEDNYSELRAPDVNRYTMRSHNCGELNASYVGQKVRLLGWVVSIRMNIFVLLQDKYGTVQLNVDKQFANIFEDLSLETVISVEGMVALRPPGNDNKNMATGEIEIHVTDLKVVNKTDKLPFYQKDPRPEKPTQLQYRYLDIRQNPTMQMNLQSRSDMLHKMRRFLIERVGFLEVETPTLFRRSPGGAQEFIVPTRKQGEFYALVQSPQQLKQLLMVGGVDRYFQLARCYRDEESQKDRQPEFTQLDLEMSFCDREGVINLIEDIVKFVWPANLKPISFPFPKMTYKEAMTTYGTDKPDTRFEWKIVDLTDIFKQAGSSCSEEINMETYMNREDFTALALVVKGGKASFPVLKQLAEEQGIMDKCKNFAFNLKTQDKLDTVLNKLFLPPIPEVFMMSIKWEVGDVLFLGFGSRNNLLKTFGKLRKTSAKIIQELENNVYDKNKPFSFLWVVDFPLFEEENGVISSVHHPFTQPHPDDIELLETDPLKVRGLHYDLVLNGNEVGGGSMRIHDSELQRNVLENILKLDMSCFQHLLLALSHGAPIHGGFALGVDRFVGLLNGTTAITDVIAFPKYSTGRDPLTGAPTDISKEDKHLYHIK